MDCNGTGEDTDHMDIFEIGVSSNTIHGSENLFPILIDIWFEYFSECIFVSCYNYFGEQTSLVMLILKLHLEL